MRKLKNSELGRISVEEFRESDKTGLILVLDNVRSALNVGSAFRTADAFRLEAVYLVGITAKPPSRDIRKTALGATESVNWEHFENIEACIAKLKEKNFKIISIEQTDEKVYLQDFKVESNHSYGLIFGNEVKGVSDFAVQESDACLEIPQFGTKHSLNISVSIGVVLWDIFSKLQFQTIDSQ